MKVTVFNGSPRGRNSNTNVIAEAFLSGVRQAGGETENIFLIEKDIHHCSGCFSCWFKTPGHCVHQDDMAELLDIYLHSDIVCFATPVYLWNMTACMKNFADRLIPTKSMAIEKRNGHYDMADSTVLPDTVIIANVGFPGADNFETMHQVMKSAEPILEIYRNCGMLLQSRVPAVRQKVEEYLSFVEKAGREITAGGAVSPQTQKGLQMELMTDDAYIQYISGK